MTKVVAETEAKNGSTITIGSASTGFCIGDTFKVGGKSFTITKVDSQTTLTIRPRRWYDTVRDWLMWPIHIARTWVWTRRMKKEGGL